MWLVAKALIASSAEFFIRCFNAVAGQLRSCLNLRGAIETIVVASMITIAPAAAAAFATVLLTPVETQWMKMLMMPLMFGLMLFLALNIPELCVLFSLAGVHRANSEFVTRLRGRLCRLETQ